MSEMIVKLNQRHVKIKGGEYVRDLVRCEDCEHFDPINNDDHGKCMAEHSPLFACNVYPDDFCSYGGPL